MPWLRARYELAAGDALPMVEAIFASFAVQGFIVDDPEAIREQIANHAWDAHRFSEEELARPATVSCYFSVQQRRRAERLGARLAECGFYGSFVIETEADEDWQAKWESSLGILRMGSCFQVVPKHLEAEEPIDLVIYMEPGVGFGSGMHETTRMCVDYLEEMMFPGAHVVDVGSGSGILSIAAARLGAGEVVALENDAQAVAATKRNVRDNEVDVAVYISDLFGHHHMKSDIVIANLVTDVQLRLIPNLMGHLHEDGVAILSGIHLHRQSEVVEALRQHGLTLCARTEGEEWAAFLVARREGGKA